jgi:hypothetical protein
MTLNDTVDERVTPSFVVIRTTKYPLYGCEALVQQHSIAIKTLYRRESTRRER